MHKTLGLDIGGANLKTAHAGGAAQTVPFPLWKHPDRLASELARLCAAMPAHDLLAVTMTGELCDCFESRPAGVRAILQSVLAAAGGMPLRVWINQGHFVAIESARENPLSVASANWLALAHFVARRHADRAALLIDTGSTTTDIIYLDHGTPRPRGLTDAERLQSGELVYTGVRRTPICAVLGMAVAAEIFATMLDAYLFLGLVPESPDDRDTADGRPATRDKAHARLARLRCGDANTFPAEEARRLAERALHTQWEAVNAAMERVVNGRKPVERIVLAGSGAILGHRVCAKFTPWSNLPLESLTETLGPELSDAACAYAVATLAAGEVGHAG